ncbi:MAG TPA: MFS transporter [Nocardioides sp.]|nr:MFS transporter [uncultured Nocardioides sp.]HEX5985135.1 MFS transporter [Nocardioides sp.]
MERLLVLVGIVVVSFNLRPAAVSVGPVLAEVTADLSMSSTVAGVLTTLPVLAFATFGMLTPGVAARLGLHRVTLGALLCVVVGLGLRSRTDDALAFLLLSLLGLAGMAAANVLLPSLVKLHFPSRVGLLTSIYTTSMAVGLTLASMTTVPISEATGSWRDGLGIWAVTALVAAIPWVALLRHDSALERGPVEVRLSQVARTKLGWLMAVFFGLQSTQAYSLFGWFAQVYRDAGFSPATAGVLLGVITGASIPLSLWLPTVTARMANPAPVILGLIALYPVGYLGLVFAPVAGAWVWAAALGTATAVFPVALTLIGLRARTSGGTAALSGFTQGVGYLIAAVGPFAVGVVHDVTESWTVPLILLTLLSIPQLVTGWMVSKRRYVEDALPDRRPDPLRSGTS